MSARKASLMHPDPTACYGAPNHPHFLPPPARRRPRGTWLRGSKGVSELWWAGSRTRGSKAALLGPKGGGQAAAPPPTRVRGDNPGPPGTRRLSGGPRTPGRSRGRSCPPPSPPSPPSFGLRGGHPPVRPQQGLPPARRTHHITDGGDVSDSHRAKGCSDPAAPSLRGENGPAHGASSARRQRGRRQRQQSLGSGRKKGEGMGRPGHPECPRGGEGPACPLPAPCLPPRAGGFSSAAPAAASPLLPPLPRLCAELALPPPPPPPRPALHRLLGGEGKAQRQAAAWGSEGRVGARPGK